MPKVTETRTQDHLQEKVTHLNLASYLYDLEAIAKETGELDNLKINYVMNYENGRGAGSAMNYTNYTLLNASSGYVASSSHRHLPLSLISLHVRKECFEFIFVPCR